MIDQSKSRITNIIHLNDMFFALCNFGNNDRLHSRHASNIIRQTSLYLQRKTLYSLKTEVHTSYPYYYWAFHLMGEISKFRYSLGSYHLPGPSFEHTCSSKYYFYSYGVSHHVIDNYKLLQKFP